MCHIKTDQKLRPGDSYRNNNECMKKCIFISLLLLSMTPLQMAAQVNPRPGYVITNSGDTIHGTIDYRTDAINCRQCSFLAQGAEQYATFHPSDIRGYRLSDNGIYYVSTTFPVNGEQKKIFAEFLLQGGVSLYSYIEGHETYYYFVDENGRIATMKKPANLTKSAEEAQAMKRQAMLEASQMLGKSPQAVDDLWKSNFNRDALTRLVRNYDEQYCASWGDCVQFEYDKKAARSIFIKGWRMEAGYHTGKAHCKPLADANAYEDLYTLDLNMTAPHIGVGLDLAFPRFSRGVTAQALLGYTYMQGKLDHEKKGKDYYQLKSQLVNLEIGGAYSFLPDSRISPLVRAGILIDYMIKMDPENMGWYDVSYNYKNEKFLYGWYVGVGADIKAGGMTWRVGVDYSNHGSIGDAYGLSCNSADIRIGVFF